jgi:hypothetical protein
VLAFKRPPLLTRWDELRARAAVLAGQYGIEFNEFVGGLKQLNPHTLRRLLI